MPAFITFHEIRLSISIRSWRKRKQRITKGYSRLNLAYQEETREMRRRWFTITRAIFQAWLEEEDSCILRSSAQGSRVQ